MKRLFGRRQRAHRHTPVPQPTARLEIHTLDNQVFVSRQEKDHRCFGTEYVYFPWKTPLQWSRVHRVEVHLDDDQVAYFPVRNIVCKRSYTIIDRVRYDEYSFEAYGYTLIYRKCPLGRKDMLIFHHMPD